MATTGGTLLQEATTFANLSRAIPIEHSNVIRLATAAFLATTAAFGIAGNILVLLSVIRISKLHRLSYYLVANMSLVGLVVCITIIPIHILNNLHIRFEGVLCTIQGYMNFMLTLAILTNTNAIAVHRYITVTRKRTDNKKLPKKTLAIIFSSLWGVPMMVSLTSLPFVDYQVNILDCFFDSDTASYWYVISSVAAPTVLTTILIFVCYFIILKTVRDSRKRVSPQAYLPRPDPTEPKQRDETTRAHGEKIPEDSDVSERSDRDSLRTNCPPAISVYGYPSNQGNAMAAEEQPSMSQPVSLRTCIQSKDQDYMSGHSSYNDGPSSSHTFSCVEHPSDKATGSTRDKINVLAQNPGPSCTPLTSTSTVMSAIPASITNPVQENRPPPAKGKTLPRVSTRPVMEVAEPDQDSIADNDASGARKLDGSKMSRRLQQEMVLTIQLFLVFFVFCLLYLPICVVHVIHPFQPVAPDVWLLLFTLALSFSTINWILYALANRDFRRAYIAILTCDRTLA